MARVEGHHFSRQFNQYAQGDEREAAMCAHMALILNMKIDEVDEYDAVLVQVLELLSDNRFVAAALAIANFREIKRG